MVPPEETVAPPAEVVVSPDEVVAPPVEVAPPAETAPPVEAAPPVEVAPPAGLVVPPLVVAPPLDATLPGAPSLLQPSASMPSVSRAPNASPRTRLRFIVILLLSTGTRQHVVAGYLHAHCVSPILSARFPGPFRPRPDGANASGKASGSVGERKALGGHQLECHVDSIFM